MKKHYVNQDLIDSSDFESGKRIKELRAEKGLTMEEFGKLFNVNKSTVLRWEKGGVEKPSMVKQIAVYFGISKAWLAGFDVPKYPEEPAHQTIRGRISKKLEKLPTETLEKIEAMIDMFVLPDNKNKDGSRND